jgi:hypothetical protein
MLVIDQKTPILFFHRNVLLIHVVYILRSRVAIFAHPPEYAELSIFEDMQSSGICGVVDDWSRKERQFGSNHSAYL